VDTPVAADLQPMIDRFLTDAGGERLRSLRHARLTLEDEFDVTLPSHMEGSVTFNVLRLYARL
jgi:hypothetical protein